MGSFKKRVYIGGKSTSNILIIRASISYEIGELMCLGKYLLVSFHPSGY